MRTPADVLELALKTKPGMFRYEHFMCWQLQRMYGTGQIEFCEYCATKAAINNAIEWHATLAGYLRNTGVMPKECSLLSEEYAEYREKFYRDLITKLRNQ